MHIHSFATIVLAYLLQQATRDQTLPPPFFPPTGHTFIPALLVVHSRQASRRNLELVRFFCACVLRIVVQPGRCTKSMAIGTVISKVYNWHDGNTESFDGHGKANTDVLQAPVGFGVLCMRRVRVRVRVESILEIK
jgi:hypothetical protein